jgi:hypothetical protein
VPLTIMQAMLGHARQGVTLSLYSQGSSDRQIEDAFAKVAEAIDEGLHELPVTSGAEA